MSTVDNKELGLLLEAIGSYDLYTPSCRKVLKTLAKFAIDGVAKVSIRNLSKISNVCIPTIYKNLKLLQDTEVIEVIKQTPKTGGSNFVLNSLKLNEIIKYHEKLIEIRKNRRKLKNN
ncbi:MAG: hypothetical protein LN569_05205 [Rickettsia endosymbiont of Labidopullus appendiculatus]|nr:hypothetical protein [Rickettsia endosymbiont of Labidopullus appendiculatus]